MGRSRQPAAAGRYRLLAVADTSIALLVTFPLTCIFWRGIWDLIGFYVLPGDTPLNYWVQTCIGLLQMVGLMLLPAVNKYLDPANRVMYWVVTRAFMYAHTLTYMFYWRGLWELLNHYFPVGWHYNVATVVIGWTSLMMLGGCRSTMWPPFFIVRDTPELFKCASRFESKPKRGIMLDYVSDAFVAQIVALGIAILCWRSAFNIMDDVIYPGDKLKSDVTTAVVGLCGCVFFLSLQVPLGAVSVALRRRAPVLKVLYEDFVYMLVFFFLALLWRGAWNLNAEYVIKELPLGGWVNHVCGTAGLMAMQTFGEVTAFGMLRDGQDPGGEAFFPLTYLRYYMKWWYSQEDQTLSSQQQNRYAFPDRSQQHNTAYEESFTSIYPSHDELDTPVTERHEGIAGSMTWKHPDSCVHDDAGVQAPSQTPRVDAAFNYRF